eukprot:31208-Eustigmatos_ZCMA.PRE.1
MPVLHALLAHTPTHPRSLDEVNHRHVIPAAYTRHRHEGAHEDRHSVVCVQAHSAAGQRTHRIHAPA